MLPLPPRNLEERMNLTKDQRDRYDPADVQGCQVMNLDDSEPLYHSSTSV